MIGQFVDTLLSFLRLDPDKMELRGLTIDFTESSIMAVHLVYFDRRTNKLSRCIIGINGVEKANVPIITPGLV